MGWLTIARAVEAKPLVARDAKIIHVRERNKGAATTSYLDISTESGLKG